MKFYGIDSKGPIQVELVETLDSWTESDYRRMVLVSTPSISGLQCIYYGSSSGWINLTEIDASQITSGIIDISHIPELNGELITSGIIPEARIPLLTADKIPNISATKITSDVLDPDRIPGLPGEILTSGTIDPARIPSGLIPTLVVVADDTERFALTTDEVSYGDTVKVNAEGENPAGATYFVKDVLNLDNELGYELLSAITPWSQITDKPDYLEAPTEDLIFFNTIAF